MHNISLFVAFSFIVLAILHLYWALGGTLDVRNMVPVSNGEPVFTPGPVGTFAVAMVLACFAAIALGLGFNESVPVEFRPYVRFAGFAVGGVLILRAVGEFRYVGFFKRVRGSDFAKYDSWAYSPFCLLTGNAFLFMAANPA